jgi:hypothetical protein
LQLVFSKYSKELNEGTLHTEKFYKIDEWNPERYAYLASKYDFQIDLVEDLALELTRAANYICDLVRRHLDPAFRLSEGVLVLDSGPYMDLTFHSFRPEYVGEERKSTPYPGLKEFKELRATRDQHIGSGYGPDGKEERIW